MPHAIGNMVVLYVPGMSHILACLEIKKQRYKYKRSLMLKFIWGTVISLSTYALIIIINWNYDIIKQYHRMNTKNWRQINISDKIADKVEAELVADDYPNIPIEYWLVVKPVRINKYYKNSSCAPFPDMYKLNVKNDYWQIVHFSNETTLHLYSAFYDDRKSIGSANIKVLGMVNRTSENFSNNRDFYCQLWFNKKTEPVLSKVSKVYYIWHEYWKSHGDGTFGPYLFTCPIPKSYAKETARVVSVVENACDKARNMLKVVYEKNNEETKNFTVCVKGLDFLQIDLSIRLIEWIEIILSMGVDKIFFYKLSIHPNVEKVLNYYKSKGKIDVRRTTLPPNKLNIPLIQHKFIAENHVEKMLTEIIPYNDCFYRNIYNYKYIALLDIDEVIVPRQHKDWAGMMERVQEKIKPEERYGSFNFRNVYFLDSMTPEGTFPDVPPYMHIMQHVYRSRNFTLPGWYVKSLFNTNETISCHNHLPVAVAQGAKQSHSISIEDGYMHHYRETCAAEIKCEAFINDPIKDDKLWEHKEIIIQRVNTVLEDLSFYRS